MMIIIIIIIIIIYYYYYYYYYYDNHYYYAAYTWLETSVDVLFKKFARHSICIRAWIIERLVLSMIRAIRECNISDAHACDY